MAVTLRYAHIFTYTEQSWTVIHFQCALSRIHLSYLLAYSTVQSWEDERVGLPNKECWDVEWDRASPACVPNMDPRQTKKKKGT